MNKGQFYIITLVFVAISLALLLMLVHFVDFGPLTIIKPHTEFTNLQNAIEQRNAWLPTYWYNLNWKSKAIVNITVGNLTPAEITSAITDVSINCKNEVKVFNKSGDSFVEVSRNVTSITAPCNVTFNAAVGVYEIYYNNSAASENNQVVASPGNTTSFTKSVVQVPPEGICSHFNTTLPRKNILLQCNATTNTNTYNYSINYSSTDFEFSGSLA